MLSNLSLLKSGRSRRQSSWDRSGGNKDNITIMPRSKAVLAEMMIDFKLLKQLDRVRRDAGFRRRKRHAADGGGTRIRVNSAK